MKQHKGRSKVSLLLFLLSSWAFMSVSGQHNHVYRDYLLHPHLINPAITGSQFFPVVGASYIKQWTGIPSSPGTQLASGSFRIGNFDFYNPKMYVNKTNLKAYEKIGAGFVLYNNTEGPVSSRGGQFSYAYHVPLTRARLSFGLSTGVYLNSIDESGLDPINPNDPVLHYGKENYYRFNTGFGVYYYTPKYFGGVSITDFLPLQQQGLNNERIGQDFHLVGGYMTEPANKIKFEPSVYLAFFDYKDFEFQINSRIYFNHVNWINIHYQSIGEIGVNAGIKINRIYFAYGFNASISRIALYNLGTHEIHIGTNLGVRRLEGF